MDFLPIEIQSKILSQLIQINIGHGISELETIRRLVEIWPSIEAALAFRPVKVRSVELFESKFLLNGLALEEHEIHYLFHLRADEIRVKKLPSYSRLDSDYFEEIAKNFSKDFRLLIFENFRQTVDQVEKAEILMNIIQSNPRHRKPHLEIHFIDHMAPPVFEGYCNYYNHISFQSLVLTHHNFSHIIWTVMTSTTLQTLRVAPIFFLPFSILTYLRDFNGDRLSDFSLLQNSTQTSFVLRADSREQPSPWLVYNSKFSYPQMEFADEFPDEKFKIFAKIFIERDHVLIVRTETCCHSMPKATFLRGIL